jgi:uncharacterized protein
VSISLGLLTIHLEIPGCTSLKEKRSRLKPLLSRLHREFNISVAEIDRQDSWQEAVIACSQVTSDPNTTMRSLQSISSWLENSWPDLNILDENIEFR